MPNVTANAIVADQVTVPKLDIEKELVAEDIVINGLSIDGDIADSQTALTEHIEDINTNTAPHLTPAEHKQMNGVLSRFSFSEGDMVPVTAIPPTLPAGSINWNTIQEFFARNCEPDTPSAPGKVYVSRVPYGVITTNANGQTTISYPWSQLSQGGSVYSGLKVKLMDNVLPNGNPRQHAGSTDTTVGVDDYVGKEWAFWWGHCNYTYDEFGQKHITAFEEIAYPGHTFSETRQTGAFGPKFWFFCKPEKSQYTDGNGNLRWTTDTGEEDGQPFTQLWGISDTRWSELPEIKRNELIELGITVNDFHIWPECLVWDKVQQAWVERPYWIHSAYCGGWGYDDITGAPTLVSKKNAVLRRGLSYQSLNAIYGAASGGFYPGIGRGGSAAVTGFCMLFDVIKNGTKFTQPSSVHTGMSSNYYAYTAYNNTSAPGYIFPVAAAGTNITNFQKNATVYLVSNTGITSTGIPIANRSITMQVGRVIDIRDETFTVKTAAIEQEDGTYLPGEELEVTARCIVLDPDTVQPFIVRMTTEDATALNNSGIYSSCRIINGFGMGGITDNVLGKHDGQCYATSSTQHTYRVQGTEYMPGAWICTADTVAIVGDGTPITIDGIPYIPGTDYKILMQCDPLKPRKRNYSAVSGAVKVQDWLDAGYLPAGLVPNVNSSNVCNVTISSSGILIPILQGSMVQSNHINHANGTGDYFFNDSSPAVAYSVLYFGNLGDSTNCGTSYLGVNRSLSYNFWAVAARD